MPPDASRDRPRSGPHPSGAPSGRARRWLREPLVLFLLLSAAVFALDRWVRSGEAERQVVEVTAERIERSRARWVAQWGREPTEAELQALLDETVDEEILYREARRLGLDRDDAVVRRRLAQKLTFLMENASGLEAPTAAEVEEYFARHVERYRRARRLTFDHVFLSGDRRADAAHDAAGLLRELRAASGGRWRQLGDPFMLRNSYADRTEREIAELFGEPFATAVSGLAAGDWHGPVQSAYGTHLVRVVARTESRLPTLAELRDRVVADLRDDRRRERSRAAYQAVREEYEVRLPVSMGDASMGDASTGDGAASR